MSCFDDDQDTFRVEAADDGLAQFFRHPFLKLRPAGQDIDSPDEVTETGDAVGFRVVYDVNGTEKRYK